MHIIHIICWVYVCGDLLFGFVLFLLDLFLHCMQLLCKVPFTFLTILYLWKLTLLTQVSIRPRVWEDSTKLGFRAYSKKHQGCTPEQMGRCSSVSSNERGSPVGVPVPAPRLVYSKECCACGACSPLLFLLPMIVKLSSVSFRLLFMWSKKCSSLVTAENRSIYLHPGTSRHIGSRVSSL